MNRLADTVNRLDYTGARQGDHMSNRFGDLLRQSRLGRDVSIGKLARHMGVTTVYISRVELGKSAPLTTERIHEVAAFLKLNPEPLLLAAAETRGSFDIPFPPKHAVGRRLAAAIMRGLMEWPEEEYRNFILNELQRESDE